MDKRVILFSVLLLGWTWTLQGVAVDDDQVRAAAGTADPADTEGPNVNAAVHNATDATFFSALFNATEACVKAPETGPCRAYQDRFFYNSTSMSCEKFIYGGCAGNRNNFKDEAECMQRCHPEEVCNKASEIGPCRAYQDRYFYNSTSMSCEKFVYGGCAGNRNNFLNERACMQRCHPEEEEHPTPA